MTKVRTSGTDVFEFPDRAPDLDAENWEDYQRQVRDLPTQPEGDGKCQLIQRSVGRGQPFAICDGNCDSGSCQTLQRVGPLDRIRIWCVCSSTAAEESISDQEREILERDDIADIMVLAGGLSRHVSWCVWHEGVRIYDDTDPGRFRSVNDFREGCLEMQYRNRRAYNMINRASATTLRAIQEALPDSIPADRALLRNLKWVAFHERQARALRASLAEGDFSDRLEGYGIRWRYHAYQDHNPNARNLMAAVSNQMIRELIERM